MPTRIRKRLYIGIKGLDRIKRLDWEIFRSSSTPTKESHGHLYSGSIGPFRTRKGAEVMIKYGSHNNPHLRCVADAERIAQQEKS